MGDNVNKMRSLAQSTLCCHTQAREPNREIQTMDKKTAESNKLTHSMVHYNTGNHDGKADKEQRNLLKCNDIIYDQLKNN